MYKLFILTLLLNSLQTFGQSKKEQIQIITYQLDSINSMLVYERNAHKLKINELNSKISSIDVELVNKNLELDNLKENLVNSENKLAELTQEVGDINEQNQKLSNSNNLSLDSIGLLNKTILKSQIKIDSLTKEMNRLASMKSSKAVVTYTSQDLFGNYMSKSDVPLTIKKDGSFTWGETGGDWNYSLDKGVFALTFEDYYGNVINATIIFKNKDEFSLFTEAYGDESYTRID